ncbi:MAG: MFS transporter [Bryobacterales bacterium]|nr:MFS transporter [Bryobacteraceae bacterium]MDW8354904.1 MFS transporter [Bryobacterales bacterium]
MQEPAPQHRSERAEGLRLWIPALSMLAVSLISYIDRNTLALLAPTILEETGLTATQYGWVISAFSVAYTAGNPIWGRWLDRWGLRVGMTAAVSLWSLASAAHALAGSFAGFAVARACLGFGEGATFPGALRTVVQTLPLSRQARGVAVAYSGGSLGAIFTPLIITPVALWFGWRGAFWFTGLIGAAWLALWSGVSRREALRRPPRLANPRPSERLRWCDKRLWSFMAAYAFGALPIAFVLYSGALFLSRRFGATQALVGKLMWIPPLGWEAGYFFWGWLADRRRAAGHGPASAVRGLMSALSLGGWVLAAAPWAGSFATAMLSMVAAMFVAAGFIVLSLSYATGMFGASQAGLIAGLGAGAWSAMVACAMPLFGRLIDRGRWDLAFLLAGCCPAAGFLLWRIGNGTSRGQPAIYCRT